ncbi:MAG: hypothetical protein WAM11_11465 [Cyanobium sp.]
MVIGSFGLILGLRLRLRLGLRLKPVHPDVDGPLPTVPRRCGCAGYEAVAVAA